MPGPDSYRLQVRRHLDAELLGPLDDQRPHVTIDKLVDITDPSMAQPVLALEVHVALDVARELHLFIFDKWVDHAERSPKSMAAGIAALVRDELRDDLAPRTVTTSPAHTGRMPGATTYFETQRLRARSFVATDVEAFAAYRADPEVARYQSWSDFTPEDARAFVESLQGEAPGVPGDWFQIALEARDSGGLVGDLALHIEADEPRSAEVGFTLASAEQGKGYATEALTGYLDWLFATYSLHRVHAVTDALNAPAAALLERVGFRREGHLVENVFFKGAWGSELLFGVLDHEWTARRSGG